ncbi:MAG: 16S rRNA (uracil(1498)-N(3))-methyltransferase [Pirellulaceae bacterium]
MSQRFYSTQPIEGEAVVVDGPEAHHLLHVMRATAGTEVVLFDGHGAEYAARVSQTGRSEVRLDVLLRREVNRESPIALTLGVALPKGDRQRWLVEKATELGVTRLAPLITAHGVAQPETKTLDKLRRAVIEASKQCGRNRLMEIGEAETVEAFLQNTTADERLIAHPDPTSNVRPLLSGDVSTVVAAIGPEGGFSDEELQAAGAAGWTPVSLGPRILRVETAALSLAAIVGLTAWKA